MQALDAAYVWPGGAVVDAGPYAITIAQDLLTPPGSGVSGLVLTNGGSGYIGPPLVVIEGGGGTGATAVAEVDLVAGVVTNVRVTCPGVNYSTAPAVTLVGGGGSGAGVGLPSLAANAGGGFVKLGSGAVKLTGTNTFAGNIVISNGVFLVGSTNITGGIELAGTNIGIGGAFNIDQSFLTWLSGKMVGSNPAALAIGANTTNDLDLSAAPWANGAIVSGGGTESFSGGLTTGSTNLYLGGTAGTLVWARVIGTGTNVFIGRAGGEPAGVVTLSGTNVGYGSEINVVGGTLRPGLSNGLGSAAARVVVRQRHDAGPERRLCGRWDLLRGRNRRGQQRRDRQYGRGRDAGAADRAPDRRCAIRRAEPLGHPRGQRRPAAQPGRVHRDQDQRQRGGVLQLRGDRWQPDRGPGAGPP
jgi:autotransporter-associated beta strand protein